MRNAPAGSSFSPTATFSIIGAKSPPSGTPAAMARLGELAAHLQRRIRDRDGVGKGARKRASICWRDRALLGGEQRPVGDQRGGVDGQRRAGDPGRRPQARRAPASDAPALPLLRQADAGIAAAPCANPRPARGRGIAELALPGRQVRRRLGAVTWTASESGRERAFASSSRRRPSGGDAAIAAVGRGALEFSGAHEPFAAVPRKAPFAGRPRQQQDLGVHLVGVHARGPQRIAPARQPRLVEHREHIGVAATEPAHLVGVGLGCASRPRRANASTDPARRARRGRQAARA